MKEAIMKEALLRNSPIKVLLLVLLLSILHAPSSASVQEVAGAIRGVMKDQNGAVIVGAVVTAVNQQRSYTVETNKDGVYLFASLPPGSYKVSATAAGFGLTELENVVVELGRSTEADIEMRI